MDVETDGDNDGPSFEIDGFEPLTKLGSGGFGVVWKARQKRIDRLVAIKVSHTIFDSKKDQLFFDRECESLGRLSGHPGIVQVYTTGHLDDGRPYLVLEYVDGGTLTSKLLHDKIPYDKVRQLGIDLSDGLAHAHAAGVLHRDIKPDNVLMRSTGSAVLGDFGIAQILDTTKSQAGTVIGSLRYIAPEVLNGERPTTASDLYSLGITLYTAMTRQPPFFSESNQIDRIIQRVLHETLPEASTFDYPSDLSNIVMSLLSKSPSQRPVSAEDVSNLFASLPETPPPPPKNDTSPNRKTVVSTTRIDDLRPDGSEKTRNEPPKATLDEAVTNVVNHDVKTDGRPEELGGGGTKVYPGSEQPRAQPAETGPPTATRRQEQLLVDGETNVYVDGDRPPGFDGDRLGMGPGGTRVYPVGANPAIGHNDAPPHPPSQNNATAEPPHPVTANPKAQSGSSSTKPSPPAPSATSVLFEGTDYNTPARLAVAIAHNWDSAINNLSNHQSQLFTEEMTKAGHAWKRPQLLHLVPQFPSANPQRRHQLLTDVLVELDAQQPPTYRGFKIGDSYRYQAATIPPAIVDEIRRGEILVRWRHNNDMVGIVETAQLWEHSIREYDHRNQALNVTDQQAGGKLLSAIGDSSAIPTLKQTLLAHPDHSKASQQRWWAELHSSESVAGLLLAQQTLVSAVSQTTTAQAHAHQTSRSRAIRNSATIIAAFLTLAASALVANRWHAVDSVADPTKRFSWVWAGVGLVPFFVFWIFLARTNKRGVVNGGCLGVVAWFVFAAALIGVGAILGLSKELTPRTSAIGLFLTLASIGVPTISILVFRSFNSRLRSKHTPGTANHFSR